VEVEHRYIVRIPADQVWAQRRWRNAKKYV